MPMMTSRERVVRTLRFETPDRVPRQVWLLEYGEMPEKVRQFQEVARRFPMDFTSPPARLGASRRAQGKRGVVGTYRDEWGSVWRVAGPGVIGEVLEPALPEWSALDGYELPRELLDEADLSEVDAAYGRTDAFSIWGLCARPFERMQFLRGTANLFCDLASGAPEVERLVRGLHEFFLREIEMWRGRRCDALSFMDDWGTQRGLLISPKLWRAMFKPLYRDYVAAIHEQGKFAFFHSDGNIEAIYPDLIEIGLDAINSQLFCMDIERLGRLYRGKVTFWGEMDRQRLLPFGTPEEVKEGVRRVRRALDRGDGGVIAQCEWGVTDPIENLAAVFEAWDEPRILGESG